MSLFDGVVFGIVDIKNKKEYWFISEDARNQFAKREKMELNNDIKLKQKHIKELTYDFIFTNITEKHSMRMNSEEYLKMHYDALKIWEKALGVTC